MSLQRVLELARRQGMPVVVTDVAGREPLVILPLDIYEGLIDEGSVPRPPTPPPASPTATPTPPSSLNTPNTPSPSLASIVSPSVPPPASRLPPPRLTRCVSASVMKTVYRPSIVPWMPFPLLLPLRLPPTNLPTYHLPTVSSWKNASLFSLRPCQLG